jgi:hypothetical protein
MYSQIGPLSTYIGKYAFQSLLSQPLRPMFFTHKPHYNPSILNTTITIHVAPRSYTSVTRSTTTKRALLSFTHTGSVQASNTIQGYRLINSNHIRLFSIPPPFWARKNSATKEQLKQEGVINLAESRQSSDHQPKQPPTEHQSLKSTNRESSKSDDPPP